VRYHFLLFEFEYKQSKNLIRINVLVRDGFQTEPTYSSLSNIVSSVLEYTPRDTDVEQLHCYAKNLVGKQKEPCTFLLVKEGNLNSRLLVTSKR